MKTLDRHRNSDLHDSDRHDEARSYLLGRLDDVERDRFEAELLADEDLYETVLAAEGELIEEYARGELGRGDRAAFAARHLGREGMGERIAFARTLAEQARGTRHASPRPARRGFAWLPRPALRLAAGAAFAALVALTGWLGWRTVELEERLEDQGETLLAERAAGGDRQAEIAELERELAAARRGAPEGQRMAGEPGAGEAGVGETGAGEVGEPADSAVSELAAVRSRADHLAAELARLETAAAERDPVAVSFLLALATRSQRGVRELAVPPQAELVHLQLDTGGDEGYAAYRVRLLGPAGAEVWSRTGAGLARTATGPVIEVTVPAEALADGRHELLVEGLSGEGPASGRAELVGAFEVDVVRGPVQR